MAFQKTVRVAGDTDAYTISPQIKKYALLDLGFEETRPGNYRYRGSLDRQNPFQPAARLQIIVNQDLDGFKMDTVNASGTMKVNIFKGPRTAEFTTQYHFILDEMVQRGIFDKGSRG